MEKKDAVITFSQSEKIKSGLIWASQVVQTLSHFKEPQKKGAERTAKLLMVMVLNEVHLIKKMTGDREWEDSEKDIDLALVMIDSGVAQESAYHLTRALTKVTSIGQRAMDMLKSEGLL
jgi:hypothetical protein